MKLIAYALAAALAVAPLAGCGGDKPVPATETIQLVKDGAKAACSFVPTAGSIVNLFVSGSPGVGTVKAAVDAICSVVNKMKKKGITPGETEDRVQQFEVNGVTVEGEYTR